jgi:hypothetical protein
MKIAGSALRLCTLGAKSPLDAERRIQAEGWQGTNRAGDEASRHNRLQILQEPDPVIEQAIETAALMLGRNQSRGYCLEMICADFLAGANLDEGTPEISLSSITQFLDFWPREQKKKIFSEVSQQAQWNQLVLSSLASGWMAYRIKSFDKVLERDHWRCQLCWSMQNLGSIINNLGIGRAVTKSQISSLYAQAATPSYMTAPNSGRKTPTWSRYL